MALNNLCFISYSHSEENPEADRIVNAIHAVLSSELKFILKNASVCIDTKQLRPGSFFDKVLARSLCESTCMVMVFWPAYFDEQHTYCTREYKAMERLEAARLAKLPAENRGNGLVIPLVIRREKDLPEEVKRRQHRNLEKFTSGYRKLENHPEFKIQMREIANYIVDRHRELTAYGADAAVDCAQAVFPSEAEVRIWLRQAVSWSPEFVMR